MIQTLRNSLLIVGFILFAPSLLLAQIDGTNDSLYSAEEDSLMFYRYKALKKAGDRMFEEGSPYASLRFYETALHTTQSKK